MTIFIREFINSYKNTLSKFKKEEKLTEVFPWISKILIICAIGLFYFLGYLFLYGYYFGGKITEKSSLIQIITVPVPFNFESVIGVGILFTAIFLCFLPLLMSLIKILSNKDINKRESLKPLIKFCSVIFLFIFLICSFVVYFFSGTFGFTNFPIYLFIQLLSIFLIMALLYSGKIDALIFGCFNFFALFLLFIVIKSIFNIEESFIKNNPNNYFSLCLVVSAIISVYLNMQVGLFFISFDLIFVGLLYKVEYVNLILKKIYLFSSSIINTSYIDQYLKDNYTSIILIIILLITYIISLVLLKILQKIFPKHMENNNWIKEFCSKLASIKDVLSNKTRLSVGIIILFISITNIFYLIIDCGTYLAKIMPPTLDTIKYYVAEDDNVDQSTKIHSFEGYVVSCKDNIYYISTADRELVTLHRYSIITIPKGFKNK